MANGFLRALAKVKLVELDESEMGAAQKNAPPEMDPAEIERILAEEDAKDRAAQGKKGKPASGAPPARATTKAAPPSAKPAGAAVAVASVDGEIGEGRAFDDYYTEAGVAATTYPAEKLLRVLEGLRAMDANTRKTAVLAMDAADDNWTIADVVLDAQRKLRALNQATEGLAQKLTAIVENARKEKERRDAYLTEATATIQRKIAELEQQLQREISEIAGQRAQIDARAQAAEGAYQREVARIGAEQQRLREIPTTFVIDRPAGG